MIIKLKEKKEINNPKAVARVLHAVLKTASEVDRDKEHCWVLGLTSRNFVKYLELVSLGTLNASLVHPREVYRTAISQGVASIIVAHNHPSGLTKPSDDDLLITKRLQKAGKILGIELFDHIIIAGKDEWSSIKGLSLMK